MSVRLSARISAALTGRISVKFDIVDSYANAPQCYFTHTSPMLYLRFIIYRLRKGANYDSQLTKLFKVISVLNVYKQTGLGSLITKHVTAYRIVNKLFSLAGAAEKYNCFMSLVSCCNERAINGRSLPQAINPSVQ